MENEGAPPVLPGEIERLHLTSLLLGMDRRLEALEDAAGKAASPAPRPGKLWLDLSKIVFGGWQVFAFLTLAIFLCPCGT